MEIMNQDERKIVRRKNRMETVRRLSAELQYMLGVMLAYILVYLLFYGIFKAVCFFVSVPVVIRFIVSVVLFYVSMKVTGVIALSKAFNRNVLNPKN